MRISNFFCAYYCSCGRSALFLCQCYLLLYSVPFMRVQGSLYALNVIYVSQVLLKCTCARKTIYLNTVPFFPTTQLCTLSTFCTLCKHYIFDICATRYLCNAFYPIVLKISCRFSLFPHFQIPFPSAILDLKILVKIFLIRSFLVKILTSSLIRKLRNLEVPTCYQNKFSREFWSSIAYFQNNFLEPISRNYSSLIKCINFFIIKATLICSLMATMILHSAVIFGSRQIVFNILCSLF